MGYSCSFVAVRGKSKGEVLEALGLEDWGAVEPEPDSGRDKYSYAELPTGWSLVWINRVGYFSKADLQAVSAGAEALGWMVVDVSMGSDARGFVDGVQAWETLYDCDKGRVVEATGDLPPAFAGIYEKALADQAKADAAGEGVDYIYDVPADVIDLICGFRHDRMEIDGMDWPEFRVLQPIRDPRRDRPARVEKRGFLASLFGRR